jgi:hypothetical protein
LVLDIFWLIASTRISSISHVNTSKENISPMSVDAVCDSPQKLPSVQVSTMNKLHVYLQIPLNTPIVLRVSLIDIDVRCASPCSPDQSDSFVG